MKDKILNFIKGEVVLCIALGLGIISSFIVRPNKDYLSYIDYRVLVLLYSLMMVVAGLKSLGVFKLIGEKLCVKMKSVKGISVILILLCFFTSMLITNDVSLITFVPFTISIFAMAGIEEQLISIIVLETIAANLGSMLTPIGNPQNLLIFSKANMSVTEFIAIMLKPTAICLVFILALAMISKNKKIEYKSVDDNKKNILKNYKLWIYIVLFLVCLGNVFHLYSYWIVFVIVTLAIVVVNRKLFVEVDYSLLFTFVGFFIFIGNMKHIESFTAFISEIVEGREVLVGVIASQVISNVPAAMLLSGFTTNYKALLYGVNLGGLGTLIASMASLISYRFYVKAYPEKKGKYFMSFSIYNFGLLLILLFIYFLGLM